MPLNLLSLRKSSMSLSMSVLRLHFERFFVVADSISNNQHVGWPTMFFTKSLFNQVEWFNHLRGYQFTINEPTLSQIHYQFNIHFTNSYSIIVSFSNKLRINLLYREFNINIANSLWLHYEFIMNWLSVSLLWLIVTHYHSKLGWVIM